MLPVVSNSRRREDTTNISKESSSTSCGRRRLVLIVSLVLNAFLVCREAFQQVVSLGQYVTCISNTPNSLSTAITTAAANWNETSPGDVSAITNQSVRLSSTNTMIPFRNKTVDGMSVLVYITTHLDENQIFYFNHCWPALIQHSALLRESDVLIYATPDNTSDAQMKIYESMVETNIYPNHPASLKWVVKSNPGHHAGAIQALVDGYRYDYFAGYDWVIRLNADVLIQNETWIRDMMHDSQVEGIFASCRNFHCEGDRHCIHRTVMTDFTIWRPHALKHPSLWVGLDPSASPLLPFEQWNQTKAEASSKKEFKATVIGRGTDRWIPDSTPVNGQCRISGGRSPFDKRNTRATGLPLMVVHNHEAGKCPSGIWED